VSRSASILVLLALLIAGGVGLWLWRGEGRPPAVSAPDSVLLGAEPRTLALELSDEGSGLRLARVVLVHAEGETELASRAFRGGLLAGAGPASERLEVTLDAGTLGLPEGDAVLRVTARDWSWRGALAGNRLQRSIPVTVDLTPPRLRVESGLTYVRRGGAAAVTYRVSEPVRRDGVRVDGRFYPGQPWPRPGCPRLDDGTSACRAALFAVAVDAAAGPTIRVAAEDAAGNAAEARWATRVLDREIPRVPLALSERFLTGKVAELASAWPDVGGRTAGGQGAAEADVAAALEAFVEINEARRARDEARIRELVRERARPARLWREAFTQLANSKVTSLFAERRLYRYRGEVVSKATHYGYDLASTAGAPVTAAARGRVIFAGPLGIYGDTVLLDHGMGLVSLYGHLSAIEASEGDVLERDAVLGRTGATGLAGGDHLHFAILLGDTYVDPREWWDPKWVREHVEVRLGAGPDPAPAS